MIEPDERDEAPAVKRRKQSHKAKRLRAACDAFEDKQMLHEYELTWRDFVDESL